MCDPSHPGLVRLCQEKQENWPQAITLMPGETSRTGNTNPGKRTPWRVRLPGRGRVSSWLVRRQELGASCLR